MALRIIEDGDRREHEVRGSTFYYTVVGWGEIKAIRNDVRNPETLRIHEGDVEEEILRKHVHGWTNVLDREGKPVPFTHAALLRLPPMVIDGLILAIYAPAREEEVEQGNSPGSSST